MNINRLAFAFMMIIAASVQAQEATTGTQQLEGFNLNGYTDTGKKSWEINGDKADIGDDAIKITNVNANIFSDKQNANLTSKTGTVDKINGDVHLQDDVVITAERGTKVTTNSLDWKRNQDLVQTKDVVTIEDAQGTVSGKGLEGHPNLKSATLKEDVRALITPTKSNAGQTIEITCDGPMEMDQTKMYAVFHQNVVGIERQTGRELHADQMQVWFDDKNKRVKKVICEGNVVVIQGGNASYAEKMIYNGDDGTLTLTGRPKIVFETNDSSGSGMFKGLGK